MHVVSDASQSRGLLFCQYGAYSEVNLSNLLYFDCLQAWDNLENVLVNVDLHISLGENLDISSGRWTGQGCVVSRRTSRLQECLCNN